MNCDCSKLEYGALLMLPLECKTILGPFKRDFVLADVLFDLYNYPNGDASQACGFVWNTLQNQWSRLLVGGRIDKRGRQYHLESGVLCPRDSYLSICSCYFVAEPTALFSARVMGCYCDDLPQLVYKPGPLLGIEWADIGPLEVLHALDPTQAQRHGRDALPMVQREALAAVQESIEPGEVRIAGADREVVLAAGGAAAFRVEEPAWQWASAALGERVGHAPEGTNLVVARRSADGRLLHWAMYREMEGTAV